MEVCRDGKTAWYSRWPRIVVADQHPERLGGQLGNRDVVRVAVPAGRSGVPRHSTLVDDAAAGIQQVEGHRAAAIAVIGGPVDPRHHHFTLEKFDQAYDVFARAADTGALKVVLNRTS
jgi:hypothetical protein